MQIVEPLQIAGLPEGEAPQTDALGVGTVVGGRFTLEQRVRGGRHGEVWRARDARLPERRVALKLQRASRAADKTTERHFAREIRALQRLKHPHIAQIVDHGAHGPTRYIARDWIDGETLGDWLASRAGEPLPLDLVADIFEPVLGAVGHAHERGVCHLDLKPANIMITTPAGGKPLIHLIDFGLARLSESTAQTEGSTARGEGTRDYMAPEQLAGARKKLTSQADVFSLGVVLLELLTGSPRTRTGTPWWDVKVTGPKDLASSLLCSREDVPDVVWKVIARALHHDPGRRFSNATDFRLALRAAWPLVGESDTRRFGPRSSTLLLVVALTLVITAALVGLSLSGDLHIECVPSAISRAVQPEEVNEPVPVIFPLHSPPLPNVDCGQREQCLEKGIAHEHGRGVAHDYLMAAAHYQRACDLGDGMACNRLGLLLDNGRGVFPDAVAEQTLYERARNLGYVTGCANAAAQAPGVFGDRLTNYSQACDLGEWLGCWNLAWLYWHGNDTVQRDRPLAQKLARKAAQMAEEHCNQGETAACLQLAKQLCTDCGKGSMDDTGRVTWLLPPDNRRSVYMFARACNEGNLHACAMLAHRRYYGHEIPRDPALAISMWHTSCQAGVQFACTNLAWHHRTGEGVPRDRHRAVVLYSHACARGYLHACVSLGHMLQMGEGVPKDLDAAMRLYAFSCERGESESCALIGTLYDEGDGVPRDRVTAFQWFERACEGGSTYGCGCVSSAYFEGTGVTKDATRSMKPLGDRCKAGDWWACLFVAWRHAEGRGVPTNTALALTMFQNMCTDQLTMGCAEIGTMYRHGFGVPRDDDRAAKYLQDACDRDEGNACQNLAPMYETGEGVPKDPATAQRLYDKACRLGMDKACAAVKRTDPCKSKGVYSW